MTNQSGTWQWAHTNVMASGLSATYDADLTGKTEGPLYFHLSDWLGTRRQQTDYLGNPVLNFTGLPFGDGLATLEVSTTDAADATEHHFTGKERDAESGNDYFGARYYASSMGRFMSPDWSAKISPVPYAKLGDPQSLNLYAYVGNNPLSRADADGHTATCGTGANQGQCASDLNKLAPGTKVAADGTVSKGSLLQRIVNHLDGNGAGQSLVSRIVNDSHLTTITADPGNPRGGTQLNGDVKYDPAGATINTRGADGNLTQAHTSGTVILGHELIHQDHENRGLQDNSAADHIFSNAGGMFSETVTREEFRTTGFSPFVMPGDITENQLERQLGAPVRATYTLDGFTPVPPQP
jgi:RHS repeat-associated protein